MSKESGILWWLEDGTVDKHNWNEVLVRGSGAKIIHSGGN